MSDEVILMVIYNKQILRFETAEYGGPTCNKWLNNKKQLICEDDDFVSTLSSRELEVFTLLASGLRCKEVADKLKLSVFTVQAHKVNVYKKLHVHTTAQAVAKILSKK